MLNSLSFRFPGLVFGFALPFIVAHLNHCCRSPKPIFGGAVSKCLAFCWLGDIYTNCRCRYRNRIRNCPS